jgi:hypothetical protein
VRSTRCCASQDGRSGSGLARSADRRIGALVLVRYPEGSEHYALTCAGCLAWVQPDGTRRDRAAAALDLASLLAAGSGKVPDWGPGRLDVTADDRDDPVAIPDLRATRHQRLLHSR